MRTKQGWLYTEYALLTLMLPALLLWVIPSRMWVLVLWLAALYCHGMLRYAVFQEDTQRLRGLEVTPEPVFPARGWGRNAADAQAWKAVWRRFRLSAIVLTIGTWVFVPELLGGFLRTHPWIWAAVMILYPLLSVVPQEWVFRRYYFYRFAPIFSSTKGLILSNALVFSFAHLIFQNWVAPVLCLLGGYFFATTYAKTRSLWLVCCEHALYGCFIFTLGLGQYFYHGAIASGH